MLMRHVFLIGMPGSGKTSLGRKVAANLGLPFCDMDVRLSEIFGMAVSEIFATKGQEAFRNAETNLLIEMTREAPTLVSTGGGVAMRQINQQIMRNSGFVVLVDRPIEQIMGDIKLDRRPMLAKKGLPEVERLYNERIPVYRSAADYVLNNSNGYYAGVAALEKMIRNF